jgi:hypothetical protein
VGLLWDINPSKPCVLGWMLDHGGKYPSNADWGVGRGKVGLTRTRFYGTGRYRPGQESGNNQLFVRSTALLKLREYAKQLGVEDRVLIPAA